MSAMVMPPPHRKPVPGRAALAAPSFTKQPPAQMSQERLHSRTRTNSSAALPFPGNSPPRSNISPAYSMTSQPQPQPQQQLYQHQPQSQQPQQLTQNRRTMSNATSSTSTSASSNVQRMSTNSAYSLTSGVRRSTSSRSSSSVSPTSYVALMRKQKGTVWCDRAQHEDPRLLAAQRQAKMRAAAEVAGGHNYATQFRTSTGGAGVVGGVRSKIRHHGAPKASAYNAAVVGGAGVPMRLSASEVDDGNESDDDPSARSHARNGSGKSSLGSGSGRPRGNAHAHGHSGLNKSYSNGSTPSQVSPVDSMGNPEDETPMPRHSSMQGDDYFTQQGGSGSSGENEEQFGTVPGLPQTRGKLTAEEQVAKASNADDLRRRGSVDDRTMTMSGVRLFVANPDMD